MVSRVEIQFHHNYTSHRGQYVWFVQDRFRLPNTHCLGYKSDKFFFCIIRVNDLIRKPLLGLKKKREFCSSAQNTLSLRTVFILFK